MIAVLVGFQLIQLAYVQQVDPARHIIVEQKGQNTYTVVKDGIALRQLFNSMLQLKNEAIEQEMPQGCFSSPFFICLSPKGMKIAQPVLQSILPEFQQKVLYFKIDKDKHGCIPYNRAVLADRQICYGEGLSQLRPKEELRIALNSILSAQGKVEYIFVQKNGNEIKQLKKQGYSLVVDQLDGNKYKNVYEQARANLSKKMGEGQLGQGVKQLIQYNQLSRKYIQTLSKIVKEPSVKQITPFDTSKITIKGFISQLYTPSVYYNITPKSWIPRQSSKQISSYVFHNISDGALHIARSSRPRDFSNQEDYEVKVLTYYLGYLIDPSTLTIPHDKHSTLMKYCKVKSYQNKKAFLNIRPYIQNLTTLEELRLTKDDLVDMIRTGMLFGRRVRGLGGILLLSWIVNQNFTVKTLCEQLTLVQKDEMNDELNMITKDTINSSNNDLYLCRSDYFNIFNPKTSKILTEQFILTRTSYEEISFKIQHLHYSYLQQMYALLFNINEQRLFMIKNLCIYYRWTSKMVYFYDTIVFRLNSIRQYFTSQNINFKYVPVPSLLAEHPRLACLLMPQNYDKYMLPQQNKFFPAQFNLHEHIAVQKTLQNPYLSYITKTCSFAIHDPQFQMLTFLQWIKSTGKYQIIQYISLLNHSFQDYQILDKRLKLVSVNDKKNVILVVDHAQLNDSVATKVKSVKTVLVYRLKRTVDVEEMGFITSDIEKKNCFQDSKDLIISTLIRYAQKSSLFISQFQLYSWILESFVKIKCQLYNLNFKQCQEFIISLHGCISTNKNRLKQIQQTFKQKSKYLYVLPLLKQNQKILFNYRLFQFLHVKILFSKILDNSWSYALPTYQNASINAMKHIIDPQLATKVVERLLEYIQTMGDRKMPGQQYQQSINDSLQVIKSLTQHQPHQNNQSHFHLYYQAFPQQLKIYNYFSIKSIVELKHVLAIQDDQNIELVNAHASLSIPIGNFDVIAMSNAENRLLFLNLDQQNSLFYISQIQVGQASELSFKQNFNVKVQNNHLCSILRGQSWDKILITKQNNIVFIVLDAKKTLLVVAFDPTKNQLVSHKEYPCQKQLNFIQIASVNLQPILFLADYQSLFSLQLTQSLPQNPTPFFTVTYGLQNIKIHYNSPQLQIFVHKLHILQKYTIDKNTVINRERYQLHRNIKTVSIWNNLIYCFYENSQVLDIITLEQQTICKVKSYHWVDPNPKNLFVMGQHLFLRGVSYIKHLRLRNPLIFDGRNKVQI